MLSRISFLLSLFFCLSLHSNESSLTIQQQIERLQREVSDLSQIIFSNNGESSEINSTQATNLSALDMRIYDLEKDIKNLTGNIEELYFTLEDLVLKLDNYEQQLTSIDGKISNIINSNNSEKQKSLNNDNVDINNIDQNNKEENTLGSLKISQENSIEENNNELEEKNNSTKEITLSAEDQFQLAFDYIRAKNWVDAKTSLELFIEQYPENQLSGSAHYWLGELYILEKKYRDAALIFAEGFQKFPKSIKAPDMLYKLSQSLIEVDKINESCKTIELLILQYPKNKYVKNAKKDIQDYNCLVSEE